jgi:hypothetical protein
MVMRTLFILFNVIFLASTAIAGGGEVFPTK